MLRRYYARGTETMKTVASLVANAKDAVKALHGEAALPTSGLWTDHTLKAQKYSWV